MLRRLRPMVSLSHKAPSPDRVFSTSNSRLLQALDPVPDSTVTVSRQSSDGGDNDPFGSAWPPKHSLATANTSSVEDTATHLTRTSAASKATARLAQWPPARSRVTSGTTDSSSSTKAMPALKDSTAQPSSISSSSTPVAAAKPVSKGSKENGTVTPSPPVVLDPAIVHPLPSYSYKDHKPSPARVYVRHEEETNDLVEALSGAVGFDIEWKVIFRRGAIMRPAATVQLSDQRMVLVIQVSAMAGFPQKLKELLENPQIAKVGVNILNDGNKLARDYGVRAQGLVELGGLARQADVHYVERYFRAADPTWSQPAAPSVPTRKMRKPGAMISLAVVTAMYTGCALSKGPVRVSDWEIQPLSEAQLEYAANDAHSALIVHDRLIAMAKMANVRLEPAKYTTGVKSQYGVVSGDKLLQLPSQPPLPARALAAAASSSSATSVATFTSGYDPGSSSSTSTSTFQPRASTAAATKLAASATSSHAKSKSVFPITYAPVSESDIRGPSKWIPATGRALMSADMSGSDVGVLEMRDHRTLNRPVLQSHRSLPESGTSDSRFLPKPRPRFKPSYDAIVMPSKSPTSTLIASKPPAPTPPLRQTNQRPQHIRAYNLWHIRQMPLPDICKTLRSPDNPLKEITVIGYVVGALRTDPALCFSRERLRTLMDAEPKSRVYHGGWFNTLDVRVHVNMDTGVGSGSGTSTETSTEPVTRTST